MVMLICLAVQIIFIKSLATIILPAQGNWNDRISPIMVHLTQNPYQKHKRFNPSQKYCCFCSKTPH